MLESNLGLIASSWGIVSTIGFGCAFTPAIFKILNFSKIHKKIIFQISYLGLIIAIFTGLVHGLLMTQREAINFYSLNTYWIYAEGILTFNLLIFWAFSFTEFKYSLKKLTYLIYAACFLLGCHVWQNLTHLF